MVTKKQKQNIQNGGRLCLVHLYALLRSTLLVLEHYDSVMLHMREA